MNSSILIISLDFELHWGGFEKWSIERYQDYFLKTRKVIPEMLNLFEENNIHVTWAGVGMLFHSDFESLTSNFPRLKPSYVDSKLSAYDYIENIGIGSSEEKDPLHYASTIINKIARTPYQEIATHTFAHYYCNEKGQTLEEFREDLKSAKKSAQPYGCELLSLVFPRNQFNEAYLKVCYEEGIIAVRDNPRDWFWNIKSTVRESVWKRLNRGLDAYVPIGKKNTYALQSIDVNPGFPLCIPASRLLRPYKPSEMFLNSMKIDRITSEMKRAAKSSEVYHLWWHPHNFGNYPEQSMKGLRKIINSFNSFRKLYGMESLTMAETATARLRRPN